jgi:hypothetical protein
MVPKGELGAMGGTMRQGPVGGRGGDGDSPRRYGVVQRGRGNGERAVRCALGGDGVPAVAGGGAVHHNRAAARDRRGRRRERCQLAARRGLGGGLNLERGRRRAVVDAAGDRLVEPGEQASRALVTVVRGSRDQRDRQQRRQRRRRRVQLARRRPAGGAVAQVRPRLDQLLRRRVAIYDRRKVRQPALALAAVLDPRIARQERAPALGDAAIDFRKSSGKTGAVAPIPAVPAVAYTDWTTTPPLPLGTRLQSRPAPTPPRWHFVPSDSQIRVTQDARWLRQRSSPRGQRPKAWCHPSSGGGLVTLAASRFGSTAIAGGD